MPSPTGNQLPGRVGMEVSHVEPGDPLAPTYPTLHISDNIAALTEYSPPDTPKLNIPFTFSITSTLRHLLLIGTVVWLIKGEH